MECVLLLFLQLLTLCTAYDVRMAVTDPVGTLVLNASLGPGWRYTLEHRERTTGGSDLISLHPTRGELTLKSSFKCGKISPNPFTLHVKARTVNELSTNFTYFPVRIYVQEKNCYIKFRRKDPWSEISEQYIGVYVNTGYHTCIPTYTKLLDMHQYIPKTYSDCLHVFDTKASQNRDFILDHQTGVLRTSTSLCIYNDYKVVDLLIESQCFMDGTFNQPVKVVIFGFMKSRFYALHSSRRSKRLRRATTNTTPRFASQHYVKHVPEEANSGYIVDTITATDPDKDQAGILTYSLFANRDDRSQDMFIIGANSGQITTTKKLDRESMDTHSFQIVAIDHGSPRRSAVTHLTIKVDDVNDHTPVFENSVYTESISESTGIGNTILTVRASDQDIGPNADIYYSLLNPGGPNQAFRVSSQYGSISTRERLDREKVDKYELKILAHDQGPVTSRRSATATVRITVLDENDNRPQFSKKSYMFQVSEELDTSRHPVIAEIKAEDADSGRNGMVRYSITGGNSMGTFAIDSTSGQLSVLKPLDFEMYRSYRLTVRAQDEGSPQRSNITSVLISVLDVNDHTPRFYTPLYQESVLEDVPIGHPIIRVQAYDSDSGKNAAIQYKIIDAPDRMPITVERDTGKVVTTAKLDRERMPKYTFTIEAKDQGEPPKSATTTVEVSVRDVNDNAPIFKPKEYDVVVSEEDPPGTPVATVTARDADALEYARITYTITSGNVRGAFNIISQTGQGLISIGRPLNYKEQSRFILTVTATDSGGLSDTAAVLVNVTDANTYSPSFQNAPYSHRLPENTPVGSSIFTVKAVDGDIGENARITYTMDDNNLFQINAVTGVISLKKELDRETQGVHTLGLQATDHGRPSKADYTDIEFSVLDVNDNPPAFLKDSYEGEVFEDAIKGTSVLAVSATDKDSEKNGNIWFSFVDGKNGGGQFSIDQVAGIIRVDKTLDRETVARYELAVSAHDFGTPSLSTSVDVVINVKDINDERPKFESNPIILHIDENSPIGSVVGIISATDRDEGINALVEYSIYGGPDADSFQLTFVEGKPAKLTNLIELDFEGDKQEYKILVNARSKHLIDGTTVIIKVADVNDNLPELNDFVIVFNNFERHFPTGNVGQIPASDPDINDVLTYSIISGNQAQYLHLDSTNGYVRLDTGLDSNVMTNATLQVAVSDGLNVVKASCKLIVRLITEDMLFNSITVRLNNIDQTAFLSSLYNRFTRAVASVIPTLPENVIIINIQDDTDVKSRILNVSFSVRKMVKDNQDVFYIPQFLRERVYLLRKQLALVSTLEVLPFDDNLCVSEPCPNFEDCVSILKFGNASSFISSQNMLFRPIHPINAFSCICPSDFTGSIAETFCDVEINLCHSNPCQNGATCVQRERGFTCKCRPGFTGLNCEINMDEGKNKVCPSDLCKAQAFCVPRIRGGYRCEKCPNNDHTSEYCRDCKDLRNHSPFCELSTRSFKNGSFLTFPSIRRRLRFHISLSFATRQRDGLLFYNGRYNEKHDFIALEIIGGQVEFSFSLGSSEITRVRTNLKSEVNDGNWHTVTVDYLNRTATLSVGDDCDVELEVKYGLQMSNHSCASRVTQVLPEKCREVTAICQRYLDLTGPFQVGGLPDLPADFQIVNKNFVGCIRDIHIDQKLLDLNSYVGINGTEEGCPEKKGFCADNPCKNGGTCSEAWNAFSCVCAEGFSGKDCTQTIDRPSKFSGDSCISYGTNHGLESIKLPWYNGVAFRTRQTNALLMYLKAERPGPARGQQKSISIFIKIKDGRIHYSHDKSNILVESVRVDDGKWHYLETRWMQSKLVILLDYGQIEVQRPMENLVDRMVVKEIMVGGRKRTMSGTTLVLEGFIGCIQDIRVGNFPNSEPKNPFNYQTEAGCKVEDACKGKTCPHNSTCQASWDAHTCKCRKGYRGPKCENVCIHWNPCAKGATCLLDKLAPRGYRCACSKYQYGEACEKKYTQPCPDGWVGSPICGPCNCSVERGFDYRCKGSANECVCKVNHYLSENEQGLPTCYPCNCYAIGSFGRKCDPVTGKCKCRQGVLGRRCDVCNSKRAEVTTSGCKVWYDSCPKHFEAGIWWEKTLFNSVAEQSCPNGAKGVATRKCDAQQGWHEPDIFNCTSVKFIYLKMKSDEIRSQQYNITASYRAKDMMKQLEMATRETKELFGTDILVAQDLVQHVLGYENRQQGLNLSHTQDRNFIQNLVSTVSRILDPKYKTSWVMINGKTSGSVGLLDSLEKYAKTLAKNMPHLFTEPFDAVHENIVLGVDYIEKSNATASHIPKYDTKVQPARLFDRVTKVTVPDDTIQQVNDKAVAGYIIYKTIGDFMPMKIDTNYVSARRGVPIVVNTHVFTLNLMDGEKPLSKPQNKESYLFKFKLTETTARSNPRCVFWNFTHSSGGHWSSAGCRLVTPGGTTEPSVRFCACDHLSTFAVIMDASAEPVKRGPVISVQVATYIGLCIALVCLLLTFVVLCIPKRLRTNANAICLNIVFVLFVAHIFYLVGINRTEPKIVCKIMAIGLQYFHMCVFSWSFVKVLHLYRMITEIRDINHGSMVFYYVLGYAIPGTIVSLAVGLKTDGYGNEQFCWLEVRDILVISFVGPICVAVFLIVVVCLMALCAARTTKKPERELNYVKSCLGSAMLLLPIFGLSWVLGLLAVNETLEAFHYLFALFACIQGLAIFLAYVIFNRKVRREVKRTWYRLQGNKDFDNSLASSRDMSHSALAYRHNDSSLDGGLNRMNIGISTTSTTSRSTSKSSSGMYRPDGYMPGSSSVSTSGHIPSEAGYPPTAGVPSYRYNNSAYIKNRRGNGGESRHRGGGDTDTESEVSAPDPVVMDLASSHSSDDDDFQSRSHWASNGKVKPPDRRVVIQSTPPPQPLGPVHSTPSSHTPGFPSRPSPQRWDDYSTALPSDMELKSPASLKMSDSRPSSGRLRPELIRNHTPSPTDPIQPPQRVDSLPSHHGSREKIQIPVLTHNGSLTSEDSSEDEGSWHGTCIEMLPVGKESKSENSKKESPNEEEKESPNEEEVEVSHEVVL